MTEPEQTKPVPAAPPVNVSTAMAAGPDGQPWLTVNIQYGLVAVALVLLPDTADELAKIFAKVLPEGAAVVRRARSGLIVPGNGVPVPARPPGRRPTFTSE